MTHIKHAIDFKTRSKFIPNQTGRKKTSRQVLRIRLQAQADNDPEVKIITIEKIQVFLILIISSSSEQTKMAQEQGRRQQCMDSQHSMLERT